MPARGDHDARRRDLSEAVWRVVASQGFTGLTMRAVAAELGASTGLVTHYFPSKAALVRYALDVAQERTEALPRRTGPAEGVATLRVAMLDAVPVNGEMTALNRVWVSSWDLALADEELGAAQRDRYEAWRRWLRGQITAGQQRGEVASGDADDVAAMVVAFTHGLVTQALFDAERFPPERQATLVDRFLDGLRAR